MIGAWIDHLTSPDDLTWFEWGRGCAMRSGSGVIPIWIPVR